MTRSGLADILETKLLIPRIRPQLVQRPRLIARLDAGMRGELTLVSAPPGYGKTTLLIDWLRAKSREPEPPHVAWVTLDEDDDDPVRFIRLLVAALDPFVEEVGAAAVTMAHGLEPLPLRAVLSILINELVAVKREIILLLDDYHNIQHPDIHEGVSFLFEHLPPRLHVAIATREDPPFPLAGPRARGGLCELRTADLRFTLAETATFLREVMSLDVTAAETEALEALTEGWIAGLQLAALAMSEGNARSGFVAALKGTHRYFLDYLVEEVLARQPGPVQAFLLRTSVLHWLTGALCEAVLDGECLDGGAGAMLDRIERANLFLVPLGAERRWYRYHHLFAKLLRTCLDHVDPDLAPELHRRASKWYEEHGFAQEAIYHALAAPDWGRAVHLIEQHGMAVFHLGQLQTILGWFRALPPDLAQSRPGLSVVHAYALSATNQVDAAEGCLQAAERHLQSDLSSDEARAVRARIDSLRALMAGVRGDLVRSVSLAAQAEDLLPESEVKAGAVARIYASRVMGDVRSQNERALATLAEQARAAGLPIAARVALGELARLYVLQGRLRLAATTFGEAEGTLGPRVLIALPKCCFGLGDVLREQNQLDLAERSLQQGIESLTEANTVEAYVAADGYIALARLRQARGDNRGALATLGEFTQLARHREFARAVTERAAAARAHLWLIQGNLAAAGRWADNSGLAPDDPVSLLQEPEHLVLARVLGARKRPAALALLDRLLQGAEGHGRVGSVMGILPVRAVALQRFGDSARALQDLERALALGEPEGYVRVFADEGAPMATLLRRARSRGIFPEYVAGLLEAFGDRSETAGGVGPALPEAARGAPGASVEPLTKREQQVLRLLAEDVSNGEIARRLFITVGTVKKHVYHIFGKLGVRNRTEAAAMVKLLNLD
jgi:LuxR family transcriptional regulator, maltose regulon positive regulatory protein